MRLRRRSNPVGIPAPAGSGSTGRRRGDEGGVAGARRIGEDDVDAPVLGALPDRRRLRHRYPRDRPRRRRCRWFADDSADRKIQAYPEKPAATATDAATPTNAGTVKAAAIRSGIVAVDVEIGRVSGWEEGGQYV